MLRAAQLMAFVPVTDLPRAQTFYIEKLGLELRDLDDYGCMMSSNGVTLRLALVEGYERPPFTILGWLVTSIDAAVASLKAAGITMHRHEGMGQDEVGIWNAPSGDRVAWFSDSEGNTLSVTETG